MTLRQVPEPIDTILRLDSDGDAVAFFPTVPGTNDARTMLSYQRVGQHGAAHVDFYRDCKPVDPCEARALSLRRELESMGYALRLHDRMTGRMTAERKAALG